MFPKITFRDDYDGKVSPKKSCLDSPCICVLHIASIGIGAVGIQRKGLFPALDLHLHVLRIIFLQERYVHSC
ncbi:MAG: hypothetical protein CL916_14185 [Deltaproteobacteria bacterium]|nr:hypothetical protein [Deltaproteobacteria bacterium]